MSKSIQVKNTLCAKKRGVGGNDTKKVVSFRPLKRWSLPLKGLECYAKEFGFIPEGTIKGFHELDR